MPRSVAILLFDQVEVLDFAGPLEVFGAADDVHPDSIFQVHTFSAAGTEVQARNGLQVVPNYSLEHLPPPDVLVLPGGEGCQAASQDAALMQSLRPLVEQAEVAMSVCSGVRFLARLGLLQGQQYCTHHTVYEEMAHLVPTGVPRPDLRLVQSAHNLWTAAGVSAGLDLALHLVGRLVSPQAEQRTRRYMEYVENEKA